MHFINFKMLYFTRITDSSFYVVYSNASFVCIKYEQLQVIHLEKDNYNQFFIDDFQPMNEFLKCEQKSINYFSLRLINH